MLKLSFVILIFYYYECNVEYNTKTHEFEFLRKLFY